MESFVNSLDKVKEYFNSLPEVIRIKELEKFIDNNVEINNKLSELKEIQKKMVNSKEYNQINQYNELSISYNNLKNEIIDYPFVEEYLELLDIVNDMLLNFTNTIEYKIDKIING